MTPRQGSMAVQMQRFVRSSVGGGGVSGVRGGLALGKGGRGPDGRTGEVDELLGGRVEVLGEVVEAKDAGDADTVTRRGRLGW